MKNQKINHWTYAPQMENLLFFACIMDEMTFNYTLDSFKASVHNIFSLIRECLETVEDIQNGTIKKGALPPIVEEIHDAMQKDPIMAHICKQNHLDLIISKIDANVDYSILKTTLEIFLSYNIIQQYNELIRETLSFTIKDTQPQKKKIETLSRLFVAQMKFMGYPNVSIYKKTKDFFFSTKRIHSVSDIDAFLSLFDITKQKYTVCLFGNVLYDCIKKSLQDIGIDINDSFIPSQWKILFSNYDSFSNRGRYILVKVESYDEYDAMESAMFRVARYTSLYTFFHHKETFEYIDEWSLVRRERDGKCFKVKMPMPQILACQDYRPNQASVLYDANINRLRMEKDSFFRFEKSIRLHDSARRSDHVENQFLNLFTAFEVLIPKAADLGTDRIVQITEILLPYLCHSHFLKLAASFGEDFRLWNNRLYKNILSQITDGATENEKICALITLSKYQPQRDIIYTESSKDNHVLLRYRLYKLSERMGKVKNVKLTYNRFLERMRWHITRLYRTRNLIVHAGTRPYYLDMLLENIHGFYDTFMRELIMDITDNGMMKLEYSYILRQSRHNNYLTYLKTLNNATVIDENNYKKILGIE